MLSGSRHRELIENSIGLFLFFKKNHTVRILSCQTAATAVDFFPMNSRSKCPAFLRVVAVSSLVITAFALSVASSAQRADADQQTASDSSVGSTDTEVSWVRTELYYGAGRLPADGKPDTRWENYLDDEVTPRFPDGLTLLVGSGQWRVKPGEKPRRNRTRILVILHEDTAENSRKIEEVRTVWKEISGHQSVLRATIPADVSF